MNYLSHDWRDRRGFLNQGISFGPMHHTIANYNTHADRPKKSDMEAFEDQIFTQIHSIPDPLKKNLADTIVTGMNMDKNAPQSPLQAKGFYNEANIEPVPTKTIENTHSSQRSEIYQSFTGIASFISNVFDSISGAMFHRRPKSPVSQYYDCFDSDSHIPQEMASENWQTSNYVDQNKKRAEEQCGIAKDNMNNCRAAVAQVEDKISVVRDLLKCKTIPQATKVTRVHYRRPKRAFIEPGSVTNDYEEDPMPDSYVTLANDDYIEYFAVPNNQNQEYCKTEAAKMKTELGIVPESTDIVKILPDMTQKVEVSTPTIINEIQPDEETNKEVITSCEDKVAKLKALLLERRKKPTISREPVDSVAEPIKETEQKPLKQSKFIPIEKKHDKRFKNPCRLTDKRRKSKLRKNIQDDMVFANEIDSSDMSSVENSPATKPIMNRLPEKLPVIPKQPSKDYFDEVKGRFNSASTDSDDSFQIVFADSPKVSRIRRPSDCDSEDSFIVFEGSPDSCFTSNDLFGQGHSTDESDGEISDVDSDLSDSGCAVDIFKLSHSLSRTVSDLTDTSLYDDSKPLVDANVGGDIMNDEVDCAVRIIGKMVKELSPVKEESLEPDSDSESDNGGVLINEAKKLKRRLLPRKTVTFSEKPPKVHVMRVWSFAARQARAGNWEQYSRDRDRFKRRIDDVDMAISWVLKPQHRSRVMFQRFMPWWNKQRRIEAEEKKKREAAEKIRREEERIRKLIEVTIEEDFDRERDAIERYDNEFFEHIKSDIEEVKKKEQEEKQQEAIKAIMELKNFKHKKKKVKKEDLKKDPENKLTENTDNTNNVANSDGVTLKCR